MPHNDKDQMVQCDSCAKWFHQSCEQTVDAFFRNANAKEWLSSACESTKQSLRNLNNMNVYM